LPAPAIKPATAGNRLIQLADQDGAPRSTHALVLEGSDWVRVRNNPDGSVELRWDAAPKNGSAKVLFGWKGGAIPQEINAATIPPCELELSARGSKITHEYEFTMPSPSQSAAKAPAPKRRSQDQFFKSRDRNGDGFVTLEEFIGDPKNRNVPVLTKRFNQLDSNKDGNLTLDELK
jgi:hypothetical protein